jgi:HEAT repeat protein
LGLANYFSKEGRQARSLQKMIQRASDKHAQSPDRFRALELLRDDGGAEAVMGLLRRFSFVYDKTIEDEQEKEWVYHELVALGTKVVPELRRYMRESDTLAWALKVLEQVAKGDELRETLRKLCEQNDNSYVRDPSKKTQLVHFMGEHRDPAIAELLVQYLEDIDEGVRFKAVEALLHQGQPEVVTAPLCRLLQNKGRGEPPDQDPHHRRPRRCRTPGPRQERRRAHHRRARHRRQSRQQRPPQAPRLAQQPRARAS